MKHLTLYKFPVNLVLIVSLLTIAEVFSVVTAENRSRHAATKNPAKFYLQPAGFDSSSVAGQKIYLSESEKLPVNYVGDPSAMASLERGQAQPLSLVSGDFDADGVADLVVGYSKNDGTDGGVLAIHRGNLNAFAPQSKESFDAIGRGDFPLPVLSNARAISVPVHPDLVAEGVFNPYGYRDLIIGARGGSAGYLLSNDGPGNSSEPKSLDVGGAITTLAVGEFGKTGPFSKLLVGISDQHRSNLMVYTGTLNGLTSVSALPMSGAATSIQLSSFTGSDGEAF